MRDRQNETSTFRHYFVDEAGDPNLFKRRAKTIGVFYTRDNPLTAESRA